MPKPLTVWITINCGKFWRRWEYQTTLPASWEIFIQVWKQQLGLDMEQQIDSKLGKEYIKAVYCHPAYLTYMQSTSWETLGWMKHKPESRLLGEISITLDMQMIPPLWQREWRRTKEAPDESEKAEWKNWLKTQHSENWDHGIWSHRFITSWQIGKQWQTLIFGAQKSLQMVTAAMKCLLLGRKVMTNLDSILKKQRCYFTNKDPSSQSYGFSSSHVCMWELNYKGSWVLKNWCFWIVEFEKTLEVPWTARKSNQSILKEISPEYSLEGLMLKLKLQYFGYLMRRSD